MSTGDRIKHARKEMRFSQGALGAKVKMTGQAISNLERGLTRNPSAENLKHIAAALNISPDWLMTGKSNTHLTTTLGQRIQVASNISEMREQEDDDYCTAQWEIDAIKALRGMDDDCRRRALQYLEDGAELGRLKKMSL